MAPSLPLTLCKNLKPYKSTWRIEVKILHTWKQFAKTSGETIELILADVEGTKIHATVKNEHVQRYAKFLEKGEWKFIQNFSLSPATGHFRTTQHTYRIIFIKETFVTQSRNDVVDDFMNFANFKTIHDGKQNMSIFCDIIGQVISIGDLEDKEVATNLTKKLDLELRDESNERIGCTLWGSLAEEMQKTCQNTEIEQVICILRWAKIKEYKDVKSVSNAYNATVMYINQECTEVTRFLDRLPKDGLTLSCSKVNSEIVNVQKRDEEYWTTQPLISIAGLKDFTEVGKAKITSTVIALDTDWSWYYVACPKWNHGKVTKAEEIPNNKNLSPQKPKWSCRSCKSTITNVVARYKLHLKVSGETSLAKIMLFDSLAKEIVKQPANELLNGAIDEIEDPEEVPKALQNLIGKTFQFVCEVQKENLNGGHDTYKVTKVMSSNGMVEETITLEDSEKLATHSEIISNEQGISMIENSNDNSEIDNKDMVTPTSKRDLRATDDIISGDQASATTKDCFKKVKIEKMDNLSKLEKKE